MKLAVVLGFAAALSLFHRIAPAATPPANLVAARLLADVSTVQPGHPFTVGVLLKVHPGWHVYWINPGDSGAPTTVSLSLPPAFTAGPIQFPVPERLEQPGNEVAYGYLDEVFLTATVTPPQDLPATADVPIDATVSWLCCQDVCVPGRATSKLLLRAADSAAPADRELFAEWAARMPVAASDSPAVRDARVQVDPSSHRVSIFVTWRQQVSTVQFFPGPDDALAISNLSSTTQGLETRVTFVAEPLQGERLEANQLPSLVAFTDASGARRAISVNVPLAPLKSSVVRK